MIHPVFFLIALVVVLVLISRYQNAQPGQRKKLRDRMLLIGGAILLVLMVVRGGLHPLLAVLGGAAALGFRLLQMAQLASALRGGLGGVFSPGGGARARPGQRSEVRTRYVRMTLDHDSGEMSGTVLEGRFRGRELDELDLDALRALRAEAAADPQSRAVLDAYLSRMRGEDLSDGPDGQDAGVGPSRGTLSADEAREVLGVGADAGRDEIVAAHRRLMQKFHPDRGGSTYLAAQINEAKRVLLGD